MLSTNQEVISVHQNRLRPISNLKPIEHPLWSTCCSTGTYSLTTSHNPSVPLIQNAALQHIHAVVVVASEMSAPSQQVVDSTGYLVSDIGVSATRWAELGMHQPPPLAFGLWDFRRPRRENVSNFNAIFLFWAPAVVLFSHFFCLVVVFDVVVGRMACFCLVIFLEWISLGSKCFVRSMRNDRKKKSTNAPHHRQWLQEY